ncbi:MAG TPA: hypothetical protein VMD02_00270 [Candidatus Omnitrophota bacterium]|nr:hypothetical protein [Candidatus Omnitrophota bacterium]
MKNKILIFALIVSAFLPLAAMGDQTSDQNYINALYYRNSKLWLEAKKRTVDEIRNYSNTSIDTSSYYNQNYSYSNTDISRSSLSQAETKELTEWYLYRGAIRELSDFEFLSLVGDNDYLSKISKVEDQKSGMRLLGDITIGVGLVGMIGGAGLSASSSFVTSSALITVVGFFITAFNQSPAHYIQPDYAQQKIIEYNLNLKKELNLPVQFE